MDYHSSVETDTITDIRSNTIQNVHRRPIEVRVVRTSHSAAGGHITSSSTNAVLDVNNNHTRTLLHPVQTHPKPNKMTFVQSISSLPPVSTGFAALQICLYIFKEYLHVHSESDVAVSWKTVIEDGEVWRLLYASYFNFGRVFIFFNTIPLMATGRYLERKIQKLALTIMIILMSAVSNLLYVFLTQVFCYGPTHESTWGFGTTMFALRMIHIFIMDNDNGNGRGDPNLILGVLPVHLNPSISPWQPLIETIFFDVAIIGRCIAGNMSGMAAGLLYPLLVKRFRNFILLRFPPPSLPRRRSRLTISGRSSDSSNNNLHFGEGHPNNHNE